MVLWKCRPANNGEFETFWPRMVHQARPGRWAYDAVTYYWLEQALQKDFYVIKWSLGGTAIDTGCSSTSGKILVGRPEMACRQPFNSYRWKITFTLVYRKHFSVYRQ